MSHYVHNFPRALVIEIEKPMYTSEGADCVRINEKYIKQASQNCQYIVIRTPNGEKQLMPKALKKVGKKVKEVFLYEDRPMVMYELLIPHSELKDMDKYRWG
jgi:uncharacterized membrane protein YkoI